MSDGDKFFVHCFAFVLNFANIFIFSYLLRKKERAKLSREACWVFRFFLASAIIFSCTSACAIDDMLPVIFRG